MTKTTTKSILLATAIILSQTGNSYATSTDTEEPDVIMLESENNSSNVEVQDYATIKLMDEDRSIVHRGKPEISVEDSENNKVLNFDMDYPVAYIRLPEGNYKVTIRDEKKEDIINITSSYERLQSYQF